MNGYVVVFQVGHRHLLINTSTMSGGLDALSLKEEDVTKLLAAGTHLGSTNVDFQMEQYVYKRKNDGEYMEDTV